jgi:glucose/arabinose dehydrogenase
MSTPTARALALGALALLPACSDPAPAIDAPAGPVIDAPAGADIDAATGPVADAPIDARPVPDGAVAACTPQSGTSITTELVTGGLDTPLLVTAPAGDPRLFVIQQDGAIRIIKDGALLPTPFLDLSGPLGPVLVGSERGLLGLAFHPQFAQNDRFYVHYSGKPNGRTVIAEYQATPGTDSADPTSAREVFTAAQPFSNHNGGMIEFGGDGMLYIALGDGGSGGDPQDRAQDDTSPLGKLLRIDVDGRTGTKPYGIPADNPHATSADGPTDPRPEIWHKGLRNPFRFGFDRATGDIYIGDVGQNAWEEVNAGANLPGINWGWDDREGAHCYEPGSGCLTAGRVDPVAEHSHGEGWISVMGGEVYRGTCFPDLVGTYFYGDYGVGQLWAFRLQGGVAVGDSQRTASLGNITSIHSDGLGELYVTLAGGSVRRIVAGP